MTTEPSKLACVIDGVLVPVEDAMALWKEFSEHMDEKRGDMAGFAKKKGWFAVAPEYRDGKAVLVVRTTATAKTLPAVQAPQKPRPQQQKARPKPKPGAKPQQKAKPAPQAGQKAPQRPNPQRPNPPLKPKANGGGGQAPPRKRSV